MQNNNPVSRERETQLTVATLFRVGSKPDIGEYEPPSHHIVADPRGSFAKRMTLSYSIALAVLALLGVASFSLFTFHVDSQQSNPLIMKTVARQGMLSQRISLLANKLIRAHGREDLLALRQELSDLVGQMERSHRALVHGDTARNLPGLNTTELHAIFFNPPHSLDSKVRDFVAKVRALLELAESSHATSTVDVGSFTTLSRTLFHSLDAATAQWQRESEGRAHELQRLQFLLLILALLTLLAVASFLFRPAVAAIEREALTMTQVQMVLRRYEHIVASTSDLMSFIDQHYVYHAANTSYTEAFDMPHDSIVGSTVESLVGTEVFRAELKPRFEACLAGHHIDFQLRQELPGWGWRYLDYHCDPFREPNGVVSGVVVVARDITEAHNLSEQLVYQASHDDLTGLVNRREFENRLQRVLKSSQTEQTQHALCYIDVDQFKVVNDTCGHVAGDELLRQLGFLLQEKIRKRDTLARLGGDEFGVLMEHCSLAKAHRVAHALRQAVENFRFMWDDNSFCLGASIGLVPITVSSGNMTELMMAADSACYVAKEAGRNRIHIHHPDDARQVKLHGEIEWVGRINQALEQSQLQLSFQPIVPVDVSNSEFTHYEMLVGMEDEDGKIVAPSRFLPAAERYNLSSKLDRWVIHATFEWLSNCQPDLRLCAINLSGLSLGDEDFLTFVTGLLDEGRVRAERISFEITETAAIANLSSATRFIHTLKERGCQFALDDFGSGLSSFAYLKNLPVDYLKIDGTFVKDIVNEPVDLAMVKAINDMGHVLGKKTIAEFVESEAILEKLRELGVDYAQGYYIGRPQRITALESPAGLSRLSAAL